MRILVAGALGEVGRTVSAELSSLGHEVVPVSARAGRAGVVAASFSDGRARLASGGIDLVVNMAGRGDRRETARSGLDATTTLAAASEAAGVPCLLVSTTRVLEDAEGSFDEDDPPACHTPYALANAQNEDEWRRAAPAAGAVLRVVNYFCPPMAADSPQSLLLPWSLVTEAARTGRIEVRSDPSTTREFVSAADVARALVLMRDEPPPSGICAASPGLVLSLADLVTCVQSAFEQVGDVAPTAAYGTAVTPPSSCRRGWLSSRGWACSLSAEEVTRHVAQWLRAVHLD